MTDFGAIHELALVKEVMAVIERYQDAHDITARPDVIRDTLLNVAGLLHMEAARLMNENPDQQQLEETFLDRARECLTDVGEASREAGSLLR